MDAEDLVYPFSRAQAKARCGRLLQALGNDPASLPPRSLRGGGIIHLFEKTQNVGLALWQGRWQNERLLAYYLQEALVPIVVRERLLLFSGLFAYVILL